MWQDVGLVTHQGIRRCRLQQAEVSLAKALSHKITDVRIYSLCGFCVRFVIFPQITG